MNLAYLAAQSGLATVLWDLDPQGAATYTLHAEPEDRISAKKLVRSKQELSEFIAPTAYEGLNLIPADWSFRNLDVHLSDRKHPTERLMMMTRSLHHAIDLLVLDCPPGMTVRRAPLPAFAPSSPAARLYAQLWQEIAGRIREPAPLG